MRRLIPTLCLLAVASSRLIASSPTVWEHPPRTAPGPAIAAAAAAASLERDGRHADGVSVAESGALTLSAPLREILPAGSKLTAPPILWTAALDQAGNLYVGAGNTGEVLRVDRKGTSISAFDTDELGVRALASSVSGDLFVGTFPAGGVYRVKPSGKVEPWFDPEDRYIWAMAINNADELFVATGERGMIYQVVGKSDARTIYDSDEAHITTLALDRSGRVVAGTAPSGLLYRIQPGGGAETLLDSGLNEISALTVTPDGVIYAAAVGEELPQTARKPGEKSDMKIEVTPAPGGSILEEETEQQRKITIDLAELLGVKTSAGEGATGRIYRIEPGKSSELVWKSDTERAFSLTWSRDRGLLFGTGGPGAEGRIYRLEPDGSATMLHQLRESQVTSLITAPDGRTYACTSNPGRVYLLDTGSVASGSYTSSVYDAGHVARWGSIAWDADIPPGTRIEITSRSGNRPAPDSTWSGWSPPYAAQPGSPVSSPPARYLQWKVEMSRLKTDAAPVLRRVKVTLLPENRSPVVRGLRVLETGVAAPRPVAPPEKTSTETPTSEKAEPPKGSRWVTWSSSDPDDDQLSHTISIRRAGEEAFRRIAESVPGPPYALNDAEFTEGSYLLRVDADDARTNGAQGALHDAEVSDPFIVDHTPPTLELKSSAAAAPPGRLLVEVLATDAVGTIARGELVVSGDTGSGATTILPCRDGICDTSKESFLVDTPDPGPGRKIALRVFDAAGNSTSVDIPPGGRKGGG